MDSAERKSLINKFSPTHASQSESGTDRPTVPRPSHSVCAIKYLGDWQWVDAWMVRQVADGCQHKEMVVTGASEPGRVCWVLGPGGVHVVRLARLGLLVALHMFLGAKAHQALMRLRERAQGVRASPGRGWSLDIDAPCASSSFLPS